MWSQGKQLMCIAKNGGFVELGLDVRQAGRYRVRVLATAAPDYGKIRILLNGKRQCALFGLTLRLGLGT
jgi:hypothetical protein